jgi:hypothetical protein
MMANVLSALKNDMEFFINGNLDVSNIRANGIETKNLKAGSITTEKIDAGAVTADKITVSELSAISADLGHITAGLVEAITMIASTITGSLIQTAVAGSYPRVELSSTANLLKAEYDAGSSVEIRPDATTGNPGLRFDKGLVGSTIAPSTVSTGGPFDGVRFLSNPGLANIEINAGIDLLLNAFGSVLLDSWSKLKNSGSSQTLQQALDGKKNIGGFSGTIPPGSTIFVSNGEITGYI